VIRYVVYKRVSTEDQGKSGLGLEAQTRIRSIEDVAAATLSRLDLRLLELPLDLSQPQ